MPLAPAKAAAPTPVAIAAIIIPARIYLFFQAFLTILPTVLTCFSTSFPTPLTILPAPLTTPLIALPTPFIAFLINPKIHLLYHITNRVIC